VRELLRRLRFCGTVLRHGFVECGAPAPPPRETCEHEWGSHLPAMKHYGPNASKSTCRRCGGFKIDDGKSVTFYPPRGEPVVMN